MARDALAILLRVRKSIVTDASRKLAAALATATTARIKLETHERQILKEQAEATSEGVHDFAAWLPTARQQAKTMLDACRREDELVLRLQRILVVCKTEAEAVSKAVQHEKQIADMHTTRKEQAVMDEVGGRRSR